LLHVSDVQDNQPTFSFVAVVCNEAESVDEFHIRLQAAADRLDEPYEMIYVDDGSSDETPETLRRLADSDGRVRIVELSRSFGPEAASIAGCDHSSGRAVLSLTGDGIYQLEMIGELVACWREGFEVVRTAGKETGSSSPFQRMLDKCAQGFRGLISEPQKAGSGVFCLLDRKAVDALAEHRDRARPLTTLLDLLGFRQTSVPYSSEGSSGREGIAPATSTPASNSGSLLRPVRLAGLLGALMLAAALVHLAVSLVLWPLGRSATVSTHVTMFVVGILGLQFVLIRSVAERIACSIERLNSDPLYIVRETVGFPEPDKPAQASTDKPESQGFAVYT